VCDQETSKTRRLKPATGLWKIQPQWVVTPGKQTIGGILVIYIYIYIYMTRLASNEILSPSNKIHRVSRSG
jgi:hypothetical protein